MDKTVPDVASVVGTGELRSQQRAAAAQQSGLFVREIALVCIPRKRGDPVIVDADEHPRDTMLGQGIALTLEAV